MNEAVKEVLSRLDVLASKLGQTGAYLWPHAVRHTAIEAGASVFVWACLSIFGVLLIVFGILAGRKEKFEEGLWIAPLMAGSAICFLSIMIGLFDGPGTIAAIFEPVGHLTMEILRK